MLLGEFDMKTALEVIKEEGIQEGISKGIRQGIKEGLRQGHREGIKEGHLSGINQAKKTIAIEMLKDGEDLAKIIKWSKLSLEEIEQIQKELNN